MQITQREPHGPELAHAGWPASSSDRPSWTSGSPKDLTVVAWRKVHAKETYQVKDLMRIQLLTVPASLPLESVVTLMKDERISVAFVVNEDEDLIGVVTAEWAEAALERWPDSDPSALHELREIIGMDVYVESVLAAIDVMQPYIQIARPSWTAGRALALMNDHALDLLPVVAEGESRVLGMLTRQDLERRGVVATTAPASEPHGTLRDGIKLIEAELTKPSLLMDQIEQIAKNWLYTRPVSAEEPGASHFASAILPLLSNLHDELQEHYANYQKELLSPEIMSHRPELSGAIEQLSARQSSKVAQLTELMHAIREDRRPDRNRLLEVERLMEDLRTIRASESDLLHEAYCVDIAAAD